MEHEQELLTEHQMALEMARKRLNDRERKYAEIVAFSGYGRHALTGAGYGVDGGTMAKLWARPAIREYIRLLNDGVPEEALVASRQERMEFLTRVMRGEETDEVVGKMGIVSIKVPAKDRMKAAELLSRLKGELDPQKQEDLRSITLNLPHDLQKIFAEMPDPMALSEENDDDSD